ncbi:nuclear transport factor 2 family protein [Spirosoma migulaei]
MELSVENLWVWGEVYYLFYRETRAITTKRSTSNRQQIRQEMAQDNQTGSVATDSKEIVLAFVQAINDEDFKAARRLASDAMTFKGVLGSREGGDAYIQDMEKMKLTYAIQKAFADGDDVCLLYDLTMSGKTIFGCGWYHVSDGKIDSLKVLFDPRPFL